MPQTTISDHRKWILARPHLVERMSDYLRTRSHNARSGRRQMVAGATYVGGLRQHRIRAQTLVLHGSADTVADPRNAGLLSAQIPGAELVMFADAGHLLFWEHPDRFCDVVTAFLRRSVTSRVVNAEPFIGQVHKTEAVPTRQ